MPTITISEEQKRRFGELRSELASEHSGQYATVTDEDVMAYLLDLADSETTPAGPSGTDATTPGEGSSSDPESESESEDDNADPSVGLASDGDDTRLQSMLRILETHSEKWQESAGEEPYEVELPDGGTETARTKDDVKAILFRHYR